MTRVGSQPPPPKKAPISQIILGMKLYMFRTVPLSIIRSFLLYTQQRYMSYRFADIYHCCVCSEKLVMMDRGTVRHVEFHYSNKFEKLVHLVGFIIRNLTRCTVTWTSNFLWYFVSLMMAVYIGAERRRSKILCHFVSKRAAVRNCLIMSPYGNNVLLAKQQNSVQVPRKCKTVTTHATKAHEARRGIAPFKLNLWHQRVVTTLRPLYRREGAQVGGLLVTSTKY